MIYNMWYAILDSKEVRNNKPLFAKGSIKIWFYGETIAEIFAV